MKLHYFMIIGSMAAACSAAMLSIQKLKGSLKRSEKTTVIGAALLSGLFLGIRIYELYFLYTDWFRFILSLALLNYASVIDWKTHKIPNMVSGLMLAAAVCADVVDCFSGRPSAGAWILSSLIAAFIVFIFFVFCRLVSKGGIGFGDIKLVTVLALICGFRGIIYVLVFSEISALFAAAAGLLLKKMSLRDGLPFAPFFMVGFIITVALGMI